MQIRKRTPGNILFEMVSYLSVVCTRFLLPRRPQVHRYALCRYQEKISSTSMTGPVACGRPLPKARVAAPTAPRESPREVQRIRQMRESPHS
jgi:hypothetical protein